MAGVLENRISSTCFQKRANRHRVGIGRRLFHESKREFDHVTETRRHDLAVLDRDALDLHDKRALARHAPFSGVIPTTVPIRVAFVPTPRYVWTTAPFEPAVFSRRASALLRLGSSGPSTVIHQAAAPSTPEASGLGFVRNGSDIAEGWLYRHGR